MLIKARFRFSELVLGALLTVGIFAMGMMFDASRHQATNQAPRTATEQVPHAPNPFTWDWLTHDGVVTFTALLCFVAIIQAVLFVWQLILINKTLGQAEEAAISAQDTAQVSHRTLDQAAKRDKILYRAYISGGGAPEVKISDLGQQTVQSVIGGSLTKHLGFARRMTLPPRKCIGAGSSRTSTGKPAKAAPFRLPLAPTLTGIMTRTR